MKAIHLWLLPVLLVLSSCADNNPVNSDPENHQEVVDRSRREGTIVISLDTIFNAGVPYAVIKSDPVVLPGRVNGVGSNVWLLSGVRAIHITPVVIFGDHYVAYQFDDAKFVDTAYLDYHESMLNDARAIVNARLLTFDRIDSANARAFAFSHQRPQFQTQQRGKMVARDRNQPISFTNGEIWQTGVRIGRFDTTGFTIVGLSFTQVNIYYVDTVHCATATHGRSPADTAASIYTTRDKRSANVSRESGRTILQSTVRYLIDENYL